MGRTIIKNLFKLGWNNKYFGTKRAINWTELSSRNRTAESLWSWTVLQNAFAPSNRIFRDHCTLHKPISTPDVQAVNFSQAKERRKLNGSLMKQVDVMSEVDCRFQCVRDERCLSYNSGNTKNKSGRFVCELSDSDRFLDVGNFTEDDNFTYRGIQVTSSLFLLFIYLNSTVLVSLNQENPTYEYT